MHEGGLRALGVGWFDEVDFDAGLQARVETVADLCAQTLQRTGWPTPRASS